MQAEQVGEDRGGELGGEVEERGPAAGLGVDADGPQAFAEVSGVIGRPGMWPGNSQVWRPGIRRRGSCGRC